MTIGLLRNLLNLLHREPLQGGAEHEAGPSAVYKFVVLRVSGPTM